MNYEEAKKRKEQIENNNFSTLEYRIMYALESLTLIELDKIIDQHENAPKKSGQNDGDY